MHHINTFERGGKVLPPPGFYYWSHALIKNKIKFSSYLRKFRGIGCKVYIWLTASSYMVKYLCISSYIRTPFLISVADPWHFGADPDHPCLWLMDQDPDPGSGSCYFCHLPSRCQQKPNFLTQFFCFLLFEDTHTFTVHHISKIKNQKESQNSRNQGFSYYFCMMIEGSRSGVGSGLIPLTSGSGSRRPKNMWIRNTVPHIWLCTRSHLNFLIYQENLFLFFISVGETSIGAPSGHNFKEFELSPLSGLVLAD